MLAYHCPSDHSVLGQQTYGKRTVNVDQVLAEFLFAHPRLASSPHSDKKTTPLFNFKAIGRPVGRSHGLKEFSANKEDMAG